MIIEKIENKTLIGIEQINRDMEPWLALKPYRASNRVVIIKEAHLLSLPAANALLKTLEEPPGHAVIIMVSDEQNLLETIISRCQLIRFSPVSDLNIKEFLIKKGVEPEHAAHLARLGQGSIAEANQLAEEEGLEGLWDKARNLIKNLSGGQEIEVFKCVEEMEKNPAVMANLLTTILRDIFIYQVTGKQELMVLEGNIDTYKAFKKLDQKRVQSALANIDALRKKYRGPVNSQLLSINISYQLLDALK
jgi:DNA polymerase-3 subunit delta'